MNGSNKEIYVKQTDCFMRIHTKYDIDENRYEDKFLKSLPAELRNKYLKKLKKI